MSLFCYEPTALPALLTQWRQEPQPTRLLVTPGRAAAAVRGAMSAMGLAASTDDALQIDELAPMRQTDFDHLLWACDLNLVRGEDSVVRALWAGKPFIWQIYPQHDDAHHAKLQAFLDVLDAPASLRQAHLAWNGIADTPLARLSDALAPWAAWALQRTRAALRTGRPVSRVCKILWRQNAPKSRIGWENAKIRGFAETARLSPAGAATYPPLARVELRIAACNAPVARKLK